MKIDINWILCVSITVFKPAMEKKEWGLILGWKSVPAVSPLPLISSSPPQAEPIDINFVFFLSPMFSNYYPFLINVLYGLEHLTM